MDALSSASIKAHCSLTSGPGSSVAPGTGRSSCCCSTSSAIDSRPSRRSDTRSALRPRRRAGATLRTLGGSSWILSQIVTPFLRHTQVGATCSTSLTQRREQAPSMAGAATIWEAARTLPVELLVIDKVMVLASCRSSPKLVCLSLWFARG